MKTGIGMCYVTEGIAQSIIIFVTIIISIFNFIIVIIITNTITTSIQASAYYKWHSQRASIHVTEQACWGKSTNLDILSNFKVALCGMIKLNKTESKRLWKERPLFCPFQKFKHHFAVSAKRTLRYRYQTPTTNPALQSVACTSACIIMSVLMGKAGSFRHTNSLIVAPVFGFHFLVYGVENKVAL
jgi:hypothetical protein